ncbi:GerMN domain-containing protein [Paenibacillus psychroresistens]|nr:GerMN domain-containing protein [Paenibacillus psychroresistens]
MYKKLMPLLVILSCILVLAGCGKTKEAVSAASTSPEVSATALPTPLATPEAAKPTLMNLYYGNEDGDALVSKEVSLASTSNLSAYIEVLNGLTKSPDDQSVALFDGFTFQSAELKGSTLTIDLTLPAEPQLGAPGEELLIESLKKTMFQFEEVQAIEVLVNGQKVESLLGHVDLPHPIAK